MLVVGVLVLLVIAVPVPSFKLLEIKMKQVQDLNLSFFWLAEYRHRYGTNARHLLPTAKLNNEPLIQQLHKIKCQVQALMNIQIYELSSIDPIFP